MLHLRLDARMLQDEMIVISIGVNSKMKASLLTIDLDGVEICHSKAFC